MNIEEQQLIPEEQLALVPSYTKLGLPRKFVALVTDRQMAAAKLGALKKIVESSTLDIKAAFVEKVLGLEGVDTSEKDSFGELVTNVAQTGEAMCRVAQYKVGIVPGEKSWIDDKLLKLAMLEAEIPLAMIDRIILSSTKVTKWGEICITEIAASKPREFKGLKRPRKQKALKAAPIEPVPPADRASSRKTKKLPAKIERIQAKRKR